MTQKLSYKLFDDPEVINRYTLILPSLTLEGFDEYFGFGADPSKNKNTDLAFDGTYWKLKSYEKFGNPIELMHLSPKARIYASSLIKKYQGEQIPRPKHSLIRVYDNNGKTADRYTLVIPSLNTPRKNEYYGFNENPFHPQGIGQFAGEYDLLKNYDHLGKLIPIETLPEQARKFVEQNVKEYENAKKSKAKVAAEK